MSVVNLRQSAPSPTQADPLFAEPGELPGDLVEELAKRASVLQSDGRKSIQAQRDRILRSKHTKDIRSKIREQYADKETIDSITPHIEPTANPFQDVVQDVVQCYRGGAVRRIEGISASEQEAFRKLVLETGMEVSAAGHARKAYAVGPLFAIPTIRRQRLRIQTPSPFTTDVVQDSSDPTGDPVAIAFGCGSKQLAVLDGESLRVFRVGHGAPQEITDLRIEHGIGDLPASPLRFSEPPEAGDWWDAEAHERLRTGALAVGVLVAKLGYVRMVQGGKQLSVSGNLESIAKGQPIGNAGAPLMANAAEGQQSAAFQVHDFDTDPANYLNHIQFFVREMGKSTGVPVAVNVSSNGGEYDLQWDHDALAELRQEMVWHATLWERGLWSYAIELCKRQKHPLAADLPDPEKVRDGFTLSLPPIHRKFADPLKELAWWKEMRAAGQASYLDQARRYHGHLPDKVLKRQILDRVKVNAEIWEMLAERNTPAKPDAKDTTGTLRSLPERQGAMGGRPPGGQASAPGGDDEDTTS